MPRETVTVLDEMICCPSVLAAPLSEADADDLANCSRHSPTRSVCGC